MAEPERMSSPPPQEKEQERVQDRKGQLKLDIGNDDNKPVSHRAHPTLPRSDTSPDAHSTPISVAQGTNTHGALNQHPARRGSAFAVGMSEDRNKRCRRTMEDAHAFVYDYGGVRGQGYFAVFDGHAGKHVAEWCGNHFHEYLLEQLKSSPADAPVADTLNATFHVVDEQFGQLAEQDGTHSTQSGCTAAVVFLRVEDAHGQGVPLSETPAASEAQVQVGGVATEKSLSPGGARERVKEFVKRFTGAGAEAEAEAVGEAEKKQEGEEAQQEGLAEMNEEKVPEVEGLRRVLYTANVGDARVVLCRGGQAVRLTYDHKGSDAQEAKRITDAGGYVLNGRVNGVLAVTRALGDASMKQFVVSSPFTTETRLAPEDEFLIIACDGLWDVAEDQQAVDLVRRIADPQEASRKLLDHALNSFSTDNLSVLVVRLAEVPQ